ncbi:MAG: hypothetical protein HQ472_10655 [Ignavibacteria bacterium]|nr:hypothetical protein [Ignavibacteria bacterium]
MSVITRSRVAELSEHSSAQIFIFGLLAVVCSVSIFLYVAAPALDTFFGAFLRSDVVRDGTSVTFHIAENREDEHVKTGKATTWALVEPRQHKQFLEALESSPNVKHTLNAEYIFKPLVALAPLVMVGGFGLAVLLTVMGSGGFGFVRQKIEREILNTLHRLARSQYGEHTADEIKQLSREILTADMRRLHDLSAAMAIPFSDLELLKRALQWRDSAGATKIIRTHSALKFYMREYFTDRYSNAILGLVYIGAAILIIVIGIRGLKFLPSTDPSVVLGALGLEFMLLITYAGVLMYGRTDEAPSHERSGSMSETIASNADADTEQLLRAFLASPSQGSPLGDNSTQGKE